MYLVIAISAAYAYASLVGWLMLRQRRFEFWSGVVLGTLTLLFPLLIPAEQVGMRALSAFLCGELMFKLIDVSRYSRNHGFPPYADYLRFLVPFPVMLVIYRKHDQQVSHAVPLIRELGRAILFGGILAAAFGMLFVCQRVPLLQTSFPLDHAVKLVLLLLAVESISEMSTGLERLAGYRTTPLMRHVYHSANVSAFWRRYNTRVHRWLSINVFNPAGGKKTPIRATLLTFFVSAVFHELAFGIATSRFDGYQFTFFMLQAPAVLLSDRLARCGRLLKAVSYLGMLVWFYFTSMLFCHGVGRIFSFYYASQPWLP